jgi:SulP family sulfate permease
MVAVTARHSCFQFDGVATIGSAVLRSRSSRCCLLFVVADGMADTKHDSNQELIGQGIANQPIAGLRRPARRFY